MWVSVYMSLCVSVCVSVSVCVLDGLRRERVAAGRQEELACNRRGVSFLLAQSGASWGGDPDCSRVWWVGLGACALRGQRGCGRGAGEPALRRTCLGSVASLMMHCRCYPSWAGLSFPF